MTKQGSTTPTRRYLKGDAWRQRRPQRHRRDEPEQGYALQPGLLNAPAPQQEPHTWLHHPHSSPLQRQLAAATMGQTEGNRALTALLQAPVTDKTVGNRDAVQTQRRQQAAAHPGGSGPGRIVGAEEQPYAVTGKHLPDLLAQLERFGGFAAKTETQVSLTYQTRQLRNGSWRATVQWSVSGAATQLPRWVDYDQAYPAAQREWDRYMRRLRQHEQAKHIEAVRIYLTKLKQEYKVITAPTQGELEQLIAEKTVTLQALIQTQVHDPCGHGAEIDAILHADHDSCE